MAALYKSTTVLIKPTTRKSVETSPVCRMWESLQLLQWAIHLFNCINIENMTIWHQLQTWHFFITAVYQAECMPNTYNIAGIRNIGFSDTQFSSICHFYICSPLALKDHNLIEKLLKKILSEFLWNSYWRLWNYSLLKVVPFFGPPDIYKSVPSLLSLPIKE